MKKLNCTTISTLIPRLSSFTFSLFITLACASILLTPVTANAGWSDDGISTIKSNVTNVKSNVQNLINTISDAKNTISDSKLKNMIADVRGMIKTAVNAQQNGIGNFMAGGNCTRNDYTPCGTFKNDLISMLEQIQAMNNTILNFHNITTLNINIEDPGLGDLLEKIPGRILFPVYKVISKLHILDSGLIQSLADKSIQLAELKDVMFPETASTSTLSTSAITTNNGIPSELEICQTIEQKSALVSGIATGVAGLGVVAKIIGAILEGVSKTVFAGPVEMDAGIHGYVHGTIKQNTPHLVGAIVTGIGSVLSSVSNMAFNKVKFCGIRLRQKEIIDNQATVLANQQKQLRLQKRILCSIKDNHEHLAICHRFRKHYKHHKDDEHRGDKKHHREDKD